MTSVAFCASALVRGTLSSRTMSCAEPEWEPASALMGGPDGLDHVRAFVTAAPRWLRPGGSLVLEIGWRQGEAVSTMLDAAGLLDVRIEQDLSGRDRIAVARRAGA